MCGVLKRENADAVCGGRTEDGMWGARSLHVTIDSASILFTPLETTSWTVDKYLSRHAGRPMLGAVYMLISGLFVFVASFRRFRASLTELGQLSTTASSTSPKNRLHFRIPLRSNTDYQFDARSKPPRGRPRGEDTGPMLLRIRTGHTEMERSKKIPHYLGQRAKA